MGGRAGRAASGQNGAGSAVLRPGRPAKGTAALRRGLVGLALVVATGCTPLYRNHGYMPLEEDLSALTVGVDTRDSVAEAVGTPTAGGILADGDYYYVRSRFRHFGFLEPQEISREVLAISFDAQGVMRNVETFGLQDGQVVTLSQRITDTSVQDRTFIRQLLGNIGNFNAGTLIGENDVPR